MHVCIHVHVCMHTGKKTCTHIDTHAHQGDEYDPATERQDGREVRGVKCVATLLSQVLGPGSRVSVISLGK